MDVFEVMRTQRSVKRFRKDPVGRQDIETILTAATWAPNGSNRQAWEFVVVDDPDTKRALADVYRNAWNLMISARALGLGTCLTTALNVFAEKAKDILDLPDRLRTVALIPVGYPEPDFKPVNRIPAEESTHWNRWGRRSTFGSG